jgi:hypothetical protein
MVYHIKPAALGFDRRSVSVPGIRIGESASAIIPRLLSHPRHDCSNCSDLSQAAQQLRPSHCNIRRIHHNARLAVCAYITLLIRCSKANRIHRTPNYLGHPPCSLPRSDASTTLTWIMHICRRPHFCAAHGSRLTRLALVEAQRCTLFAPTLWRHRVCILPRRCRTCMEQKSP